MKARIVNGSGKRQILKCSYLFYWEIFCSGANVTLKGGFFAHGEVAGVGLSSNFRLSILVHIAM